MSDELEEYQYRERCLREKGEQCTVCGSEEDIVVHHVDGDRDNNDLDNLIPVCRKCHTDIHSKKKRVGKWVRKLGYKPRSGEYSTIKVADEHWRRLNSRKEPGESFDDVIGRLLEEDLED